MRHKHVSIHVQYQLVHLVTLDVLMLIPYQTDQCLKWARAAALSGNDTEPPSQGVGTQSSLGVRPDEHRAPVRG